MHLNRHLSTPLIAMLATGTMNVTRAFAGKDSAVRRAVVVAHSQHSVKAFSTSATPRDSLAETNKFGEFQRRDSAWRNWVVNSAHAEFPAEAGRYCLIVAFACPWAHRTLITRALKGLDDAIDVEIVHPVWQATRPDIKGDNHRGWVFGDPDGKPLTNSEGRGGPIPPAYPGNERDKLFGFSSIRDFYDKAGDTEGKYTVPILWDKKSNTIVSNESSEIIRMLNSEFNDFAENKDLDIYPNDKELQDKINKINEWVYSTINNGVYRCGFAKSQSAYDTAIDELTQSLDRVESILQKQRFIADDKFTEADIRLFVTLLRFDEVYIVYFKTNTRSVANSPAMLNYCREIYQMPGVKETVNMEQIKAHYFSSHPQLNYYSIIPKGSDFIKLLEQPHDRDSM